MGFFGTKSVCRVSRGKRHAHGGHQSIIYFSGVSAMGKILHFSRCSTGEKQRMAQDQNTEEVSRSIRMPKYIWDALDAEEERRPRGASDDPRHPAVKPCGATERRGRNGGVPGLPCVFRPPRPVLGYAGWRYSFGHSPRSFSAAVTSNPAAGVIANPGGFGFFLWALRLIAIFCANSITAELPFDSALLIIQSAAQDRALLYPNRSPSKRVRTVVIAAFLRAISPSRSAFSLLLFIVNQYQKTNETGNLFAGSPFEETRRGGHSRNERCPIGAESESRLSGRNSAVTAPACLAVEGSRKERRDWSTFCTLQGLPPDFELPGWSRALKYRVVGNGVPIPLGRMIARAIRDRAENVRARCVTRVCACGCAREVTGKWKTATATCRKRLERRRKKAPVTDRAPASLA